MARPKLPELPDPLKFLEHILPPPPPNPFERNDEGDTETTSTSPVTTQETIAYQNRELSKVLLALEAHLNQGCKIFGKACDCCGPKHPLELEKLSEEALTMTNDPIYHNIIRFAHDVEQKANVSAVENGLYESEYPILAIQARDLRKRIMASGKAQAALGMIQRGELEIGDDDG